MVFHCRNNREKIHHDTFLDAPGFPWSHSHGFLLFFFSSDFFFLLFIYFFLFWVISPSSFRDYPLIADLQHHFRPQVTELSRNERADSCPTFLTYFFLLTIGPLRRSIELGPLGILVFALFFLFYLFILRKSECNYIKSNSLLL